MYSIYILYFIILVILFLLLINKLNFRNKENFNSNINGSIVILNKLIRRINSSTDFSNKDKRLVKLISLDTIEI